ncbi:MAG TPA: protein translocase subunit SecD [Anaerolineae bacterium]|nr:protein translocase subunit SecD [Anaerolineae bacterium]
MASRTLVWLVLTIVLALAAAFVSLASSIPVKLGLDLSGGTQVLLEAISAPGQTLDDAAMERTRQIIENRVNAFGLTEPVVQRAGSNRILVELPNEKDPARAVSTIQQTGQLEFVEAGFEFFPDGAILRTSTSPTPTNVLTATEGLTGTNLLNPTPPATATPVVTDTSALTSTTPITPAVPTVDPLEAQFGPIYPTLITGADLRPESLQLDEDEFGRPAVAFEVVADKVSVLQEYTTVYQPTSSRPGGYLCIVLDNRVQSCPQIQSALPGRGIITVGGDVEQAQSLLTLLRYGALPVSMQVVSSNTVGPTLGEDSIRASVIAGAIGLSAVAVFMLLYYRVAGLVAVLALMLYGLVTFALFKLIPVTLTLPGIAGFILSVGVAVDGNTLIFERMKEELRSGRRLGVAVDVGFERAWTSIRDSNVSTLITCVILFIFGSQFGASIVKGFALTLAIGVFLSLFTSIRVTRMLLHLITDNVNLENRPHLFGA